MSFIGNILGSAIQARSADKASNAQRDSAREANELMRYQYDTSREDQAPYRAAGVSALEGIQKLLGDPNSITSDPGYQFGLNQGTKALNSGAAARGMTYSGQQGKALQRYGNDFAGTKLDQSFNRLAAVAGIGQTANAQGGVLGANYANNAGNNLIGMGNASAANALARGTQFSNAINATSAYGDRNGWFGGSSILPWDLSGTNRGSGD
jgi:hypothetical protein